LAASFPHAREWFVSIGETETMHYQDANGLCHESYEAACHYYGADTPAQLAAEAAAEAEEWLDHCSDHGLFLTVVHEAEPAPCVGRFWDDNSTDDECPF
jgi:hypothetical protein